MDMPLFKVPQRRLSPWRRADRRSQDRPAAGPGPTSPRVVTKASIAQPDRSGSASARGGPADIRGVSLITILPGSRSDRSALLTCSKCKRLREKSGGVFFGAAFACRACFQQGSVAISRRRAP
jgi:hypothetical protein